MQTRELNDERTRDVEDDEAASSRLHSGILGEYCTLTLLSDKIAKD